MKNKKSRSLMDDVVSLIRQGYNDEYVIYHLYEIEKTLESEQRGRELIEQAKLFLATEHETNLNRIRELHIARYNRQINRLLSVEEGDDKFGRNRKIKAVYNALQTMAQLQNLLRITNDTSLSVELNDNVQVNVSDTSSKFDPTKLTFEEQLELYEYIKITKKNENEIKGVSEANVATNTEVKYITSTEAETVNIEQIKQEESPKSVASSTVIASDPISLLRKRLKEIAAKEIARVGGKLTDEEKQYLKN